MTWEKWDQLQADYHLEDKVLSKVARNDSNIGARPRRKASYERMPEGIVQSPDLGLPFDRSIEDDKHSLIVTWYHHSGKKVPARIC